MDPSFDEINEEKWSEKLTLIEVVFEEEYLYV